MNSKKGLLSFIACAIVFYALAGIAVNPLIIWTALPLYISYVLTKSDRFSSSISGRYSSYGFNIASVGFSLFYHLAWFFDWQGTQTSSSTSAIIFIIMPIYAVVLGFGGLLVGGLIGRFQKSK